MLGVTFKPAGARCFLGLPLGELAGSIVSSSELPLSDWDDLLPRVAETAGIPARVRAMQEFLIRLLRRADVDRCPAVDLAVREIELSRGGVRIRELSDRVGWTRRHLDREFSEHVGLSPKAFATIVRFQHLYARGLFRETGRAPSRNCTKATTTRPTSYGNSSTLPGLRRESSRAAGSSFPLAVSHFYNTRPLPSDTFVMTEVETMKLYLLLSSGGGVSRDVGERAAASGAGRRVRQARQRACRWRGGADGEREGRFKRRESDWRSQGSGGERVHG